MRRPSPRLAEGLVTHIDRAPIDLALARRQWRDYATLLVAHGWTVVQAPPADDCPDGVFVEDPVFVYGDLAVLCRSGAPQRRTERAGLPKILAEYGYHLARIEAPGTLDGGDVLKHGGRVWVGDAGTAADGTPLGRSDAAGIAQLAELLASRAVPVEAVPLLGALHLKSLVTALPDGTILGMPSPVTSWSGWPAVLDVPEPTGAHVVLLGQHTVLMAGSAPLTADLLVGRGPTVVTADISEFEKLEGCVTCLSVRMRY